MLLSTNDGTTLLGANCDSTYYDDVGGWDIRCLGPVPIDRPSTRRCARPSAADVAVDYVGDHLGRLPVVVAGPRRPARSTCTGSARSSPSTVGEEKAAWARRGPGIVAGGCWPSPPSSGGACSAATTRRTAPVVAGRARRRGARDDACCSTAPTASGPRPSRPSSCSPRSCRPRRRLRLRCSDVRPSSTTREPAMAHSTVTTPRRQARRPAGRAARASAGSSWRSAAEPTRRSSPPSPTRTLGADAVHAVTAVSPSLAGAEHDDCRALAGEWGLRWTPVETDEMARAAYRVNDTDRCYHCKAELMDVLAPIAAARATPPSCSASTSTTSATTAPASARPPRPAPRSRSSPPGSPRPTSARRRAGSACARGTSRPRRAWPAGCRTGRRSPSTVLSRGRARRGGAARPRASPRSASATTATRPASRSSSTISPRCSAEREDVVAGVRGRRLPLRHARPRGLPLAATSTEQPSTAAHVRSPP